MHFKTDQAKFQIKFIFKSFERKKKNKQTEQK